MKHVMGIDPGKKGALAILSMDGKELYTYRFQKQTFRDIVGEINRAQFDADICFLERVWGRELDGPARAFVFGEGYGMLQVALIISGIPNEKVLPATWMRYLGCLTGGKKSVTKSKAQELFPGRQITLDDADAILIAEYGRRILIEKRGWKIE